MSIDREQVEAGFKTAQEVRTLQKMRNSIKDPDYWRHLNPTLTISDYPCREVGEPYQISGEDQEH